LLPIHCHGADFCSTELCFLQVTEQMFRFSMLHIVLCQFCFCFAGFISNGGLDSSWWRRGTSWGWRWWWRR